MTAADSPSLPGLHLAQTSVSEMDNNVYLLIDTTRTLPAGTHPALLIDAADDAAAVLALAADNNATITDVLTTHQHWDHVRATEEVLAATGARHIVPAPDAPNIPGRHDVVAHDGDVLDFGDYRLSLRVVGGHTPGGFLVEAPIATDAGTATALFVGDNLFPGGVGMTETPEAFAELLDGITAAVFDVYDDEVLVYPGHGKHTTVGAERPQLPEWRERGW
ncbi:hypothetical protein C1Y63_07315 [Corynebacterium sp. 13CS0277]|uniref:MBL fold metallo-hydrolase n=1 Tax=Corynebacterium sp. 13CS0277 TaxID=2071994 RepID=UPI000D0460C3|nr:MBL fold metallo-hydrolase [Corynebacterium sp. 13CS0277]PRQ11196.1 hypothetical protein C1Y63_07315 [Corynebacterium sp. 13CS0277]